MPGNACWQHHSRQMAEAPDLHRAALFSASEIPVRDNDGYDRPDASRTTAPLLSPPAIGCVIPATTRPKAYANCACQTNTAANYQSGPGPVAATPANSDTRLPDTRPNLVAPV